MPAAEYICACGHPLDAHARPSAPREPWGGCTATVQDGLKVTRCDCAEAWPVEEDEA